MFVTNWISTTKIQKISEITNFFRHYFLSRTEVKRYVVLPAANSAAVATNRIEFIKYNLWFISVYRDSAEYQRFLLLLFPKRILLLYPACFLLLSHGCECTLHVIEHFCSTLAASLEHLLFRLWVDGCEVIATLCQFLLVAIIE